MTVKAPTHVHAEYRFGHLHLTYVAMARLTTDSCTEVRLMAEVNKIGHIVHFLPGDGFISLPITENKLYIRILRFDGLVASDAPSHRGDSGDIGSQGIRVAIQAAYFGFRVNQVFKGDRLLGRSQCNLTTDKNGNNDNQQDCGDDQWPE
jgi:hypothetical protein